MARITRWKSRHRENSSSGSTSTSDAPMGRDLPIREKRKKLQTPQTSITGSSSSTPEDTISEGGDTANSVSGDTIALGSNAMDTDERQPDLTIHALPHKDGMIVSVRPPREPANPSLHHVPCDIVLVIDVSGSMSSEAPVPGNPGEVKERYGLSVLDLTKHAANTILETLNENDRLGIVTFASDVQVVQKLIPMRPKNKQEAKKRIANMVTRDMTNLWGGIQTGLKLFEDCAAGSKGGVPALMVLTDGLPNHMCPPQGYVPKLRNMGRLPATLHTFGFGFNLRSGLLKSIAEIGGGTYSFIPDAGMIGTIFVHAIANLQATYADNTVLRLTYPAYLGLEETTGEAVDKQKAVITGTGPDATAELTISLSTLQYGHPRDIYLRYGGQLQTSLKEGLAEKAPPVVSTVLEYQNPTSHIHRVAAARNILDVSTALSDAEIAYHVSRSALISYLSSLYPLRPDEEHVHPNFLPTETLDTFNAFVDSFPAANPVHASDPACQSLVQDLCGPMRTGQIALAVGTEEYWNRWGKHYLPSLAGAYARQTCNSFKDPGPLMFGRDSPLFIKCRDRLDAAFDKLPAPKPSNKTSHKGKISMSRYNRSSNPCFAGCSSVLLASTAGGKGENGGRVVRIGRLRAGMSVQTPKGPRRVVAVLKTPVRRERMCIVGEGEGVLVTPWHPVSFSSSPLGGGRWVFPGEVARREVRYTGSIYSILLQRDEDVDAHAIMVGGVWGVTLGHGQMAPAGLRDVRAHQFLGDYDRVTKSLGRLHTSRSGLVLGGGVTRNPRTGLVDGFKRASALQVRDATKAVGTQSKLLFAHA